MSAAPPAAPAGGAAKPPPYILTLNPATTTTPAARQEIRALMKDPPAATLFLRALVSIQDRPVSRPDSYTRIASIHGSPAPFDGINPFPKADFGGYCQHNTQLFGPWHRPYLMMLEQVLWAEANRMAAEYKVEKDKYVAAARRMRLPFWDWGAKSADVPLILTQWSVEVTMPDGSKKKIRNPLSNYTIPADALKAFKVEDADLRTITRNPRRDPQTGSLTTSVPDLQRAVKSSVPHLRSSLVSMFKTGNFECFSNRDKPASLQCSTEENVESVHDNIHVIVGGMGGQMTLVELAAFDPIFWLHHCNVDRHLAIWEGIYPKGAIKEGAPATAGIGSTQSTAVTIRSTDPMYPFRKTDKTWWTPRDIMNVYDANKTGTRRLGYYYPEFQDPKVTPAQLLAQIDNLYNDNKGVPRTAMALPAIDTRRIKGPFRLEVDLQPVGPPSDRADRALPAPLPKVRAGVVGVFKRVDPSACDNCSKLEGKVRANIDITEALAQIQATTPAGTKVKVTVTAVPLVAAAGTKGDPLEVGTPIIYTTVDGNIVPAAAAAFAPPPAAAAAAAAAGAAPAPAARSAAAPVAAVTLPDFVGLAGLKGVVGAAAVVQTLEVAEAAKPAAQ